MKLINKIIEERKWIQPSVWVWLWWNWEICDMQIQMESPSIDEIHKLKVSMVKLTEYDYEIGNCTLMKHEERWRKLS